MSKSVRVRSTPIEPVLLSRAQSAQTLGTGQTRFAELEKVAGFPRPIWLGARGKRYVREELIDWARSLRDSDGGSRAG